MIGRGGGRGGAVVAEADTVGLVVVVVMADRRPVASKFAPGKYELSDVVVDDV